MQTTDSSTFFDHLPFGAYRLTLEGEFLLVNAEFAKIHGYKSSSEFHKSLGNGRLNPYAEASRLDAFQTELLTQGLIRNHTAQWIRHKTGELLWVRENARLVCDSNRMPLFYEGTAEDIEVEHLHFQSLQNAAEILSDLLQAIPDQLWLKDLYGVYRACNQKYGDAIGIAPAKLVGTSDADHPAAPLAAHYFVSDETIIRMGRPVTFEVEVRNGKSNEYDTFEIIKSPVRGGMGGVNGVLALARNISERRHAENQLRNASEHLELALLGKAVGRWEYHLLRERGFFMDAHSLQLLGYIDDRTERGRQFGDLVHPDDLPHALHLIHAHIEGNGSTFSTDLRMLHSAGHWVWLKCSGKVVQRRQDTTPLRLAGTLIDISQQKMAEKELREAKAGLKATLDALPCMAFEMTETGIFRAIHCMDASVLGLHSDDLVNRSVVDVLPPEAAAVCLAAVREALTLGRSKGHQYSLQVRDTTHWFELSVVLKNSEPNEEIRLLAISHDITEHKTSGDSLTYLAFHDALTGLPNRRLLLDRIQRALIASTRTGQCGALMFLDLDHFKLLNDSHGHTVGDQILISVARRLQLAVRDVDTVARLGGDEFVILISSLSQDLHVAQAQALLLGEKVLERLRPAHQIADVSCVAKPSIGIALFAQGDVAADKLLHQADAAMYRAKSDGRNRLHCVTIEPDAQVVQETGAHAQRMNSTN